MPIFLILAGLLLAATGVVLVYAEGPARLAVLLCADERKLELAAEIGPSADASSSTSSTSTFPGAVCSSEEAVSKRRQEEERTGEELVESGSTHSFFVSKLRMHFLAQAR